MVSNSCYTGLGHGALYLYLCSYIASLHYTHVYLLVIASYMFSPLKFLHGSKGRSSYSMQANAKEDLDIGIV